jgi:hypothetical protein
MKLRRLQPSSLSTGGKSKRTADQLAEEGVEVNAEALRSWRDRSFPQRYAEIRRELGHDVGERVAGQALERALQADELLQNCSRSPRKSSTTSHPLTLLNRPTPSPKPSRRIPNAQLLRDRPTEITEVRSVEENLATLERCGVIKKVEQPQRSLRSAMFELSPKELDDAATDMLRGICLVCLAETEQPVCFEGGPNGPEARYSAEQWDRALAAVREFGALRPCKQG